MFINLVAPINPLGYGVVGFNILKFLTKAGHNVSYFPLGQPEWTNDAAELIQAAIKNSEFFNAEAPSLRIWHQHDMAMFPGGGERIGWPIFELDTFNEKELHHLSSVDRIFVCSHWAKDIVESAIDKPVDVVPLGVDTSVFHIDEAARKKRPYHTKNSTIFLNVGKWEVRKGHKELLEAFNKAFTPDDEVELWMLNHNPFIGAENEQWKRDYISSPMGSKIKILPRMATQHDLCSIYNQVDCGVFPSHAEGWNLEALEVMACGGRVIATDYSGHTEFLSQENSLLLDVTGMEKADDGRWFHGVGNWATFSIDQLVEHMRTVHADRQSGCTIEVPSVAKFTWEQTVGLLEEIL